MAMCFFSMLHVIVSSIKVRKKAKFRKRYNQVPHLSQDTIKKSDKGTRKHHTKESEEVNPVQSGDHKAARNKQDSLYNLQRQERNTITKRIHKRSTALEWSVRQLLEGLNIPNRFQTRWWSIFQNHK